MSKTVREIERLAGLLEGEGHFRWDRRPEISVQMNDRDVIEWAGKVLGAKRVLGPYRYGKRSPNYIVKVYGVLAAGWMMTLYSLLGLRRKAQIRKALARWKKQRTVMGRHFHR